MTECAYVGHDCLIHLAPSFFFLFFFNRLSSHSHPMLLFSMLGNNPDLDTPCLLFSAGHKEAQDKLFILPSFQENKPKAAERPSVTALPGGQLFLCGCDLSLGPVTESRGRPVQERQCCVHLLNEKS